VRTIPEIEAYAAELEAVRRDLHAHPELAYEERRTAQIVADLLSEWGIELDRGVRCFDPAVREAVIARINRIATSVAQGFGATAEVRYGFQNPAVINEPQSTSLAASVAARIVGSENVDTASEPVLGSEDFAFMREKVPGCYLLIGNGADEGGCMIHNSRYDFNDNISALGATYWVRPAQSFLALDRS